MNPNDWTPSELLNIGMCTIVLLYCLYFATRQALKSQNGVWPWRLLAILTWGGTLILFYSAAGSRDASEAPSRISGICLLLIGIVGTLIGSLMLKIRQARKRKPKPTN